MKAEEKVRFFTWLLLQDRLWTADRLQRRGWTHDDKCCLCDQDLESAKHLFLECPFAKEVWAEMASSDAVLVQVVNAVSSIQDYWTELSKGSKQQITTASYPVHCVEYLERAQSKNLPRSEDEATGGRSSSEE